MDEQSSNSFPQKILPIALIAIIVIAAIVVYSKQNNSSEEDMEIVSQSSSPTNSVTNISPAVTEITPDSEGIYKDGTYQVVGNYVSPGGPREINVGITLENGIVTDTTFEGTAEDPPTKRFQGEFADNYKDIVIGKNISELNLVKVSGSSLTPIGFNDALQKIKQQAVS